MPRPRSHARRLVRTAALVLMVSSTLAEDAKPPSDPASGEASHTSSPPSGASPESLSSAPPAGMSSPPDPSAPPTTTGPPHTELPAATAEPPKPTETTPAPPASSSPSPTVTPAPTAATTPAPSTSMDANATKPTGTPPSPTASPAAPPPLSIPMLESPNTPSRMPLGPTATAAALPQPTVSSDTIDFVASPATTVPVPSNQSTSTTSDAERSTVVSYSLAGGAGLLIVLVLIVFLIVRRSREAVVKRRGERTQAMSEMFLTSTTHREPSTASAHAPHVDVCEDPNPYDVESGAASHEVEDDAFAQITILPSPGSIGSISSEASDSYRSSYVNDENSSLSGFFDDVPPLSGSSARSSSFFGPASTHSSMGYDSEMDL